VGCNEIAHHRNCSEYILLNMSIKEITCKEGYLNLLSYNKEYAVLGESAISYTVMCDNGHIKKLSKKLFYK
jgi:hypothetical protein